MSQSRLFREIKVQIDEQFGNKKKGREVYENENNSCRNTMKNNRYSVSEKPLPEVIE